MMEFSQNIHSDLPTFKQAEFIKRNWDYIPKQHQDLLTEYPTRENCSMVIGLILEMFRLVKRMQKEPQMEFDLE